MIVAAEDPFAIHLIIHSADKILNDLSKRMGKPLLLDLLDVEPEERKRRMQVIRGAYNFLKHADRDHDHSILFCPGNRFAEINIMMLGLCALNYQTLFGEMTAHMDFISKISAFLFPDCFIPVGQRPRLDKELSKLANARFGDLVGAKQWPKIVKHWPKIVRERQQDVRETARIGAKKFKNFAKPKTV
jgi:hypothetical protein